MVDGVLEETNLIWEALLRHETDCVREEREKK